MTGQEMINEVENQLRNDNIESLIQGWLTDAVDALASRYLFRTLISRNSKTTTATQPDITLDDNFYLPLLFLIPNEDRKLEPVSEAELATCYPKYRTTTGTIQDYYLNGKTLSLFYVPASTGTIITYAFIKQPAKPKDGLATEYIDLPREWHQIICLRAIRKGAKYMGDIDILSMATGEEKDLLRELKPTLYQRPDIRHVLKSFNNLSGRPGRPILNPAHFERP